ncbi:MAG: thioesterase family protein [Myxococcota bacterium]
MDASFAAVSTVKREAPGRYQAHVPPGWEQGRGIYGGLVFALLARAIEAEADPDRTIRSLSGEIPEPVPAGPLEIEVERIRRGSSLSNYRATIQHAGQVKAQTSAIVAAAREVDLTVAVDPPSIRPWKDAPKVEVPPGIGPPFASNFDFRPFEGLPFVGAKTARIEGWVQFKTPLSAIDVPAVAALADSYWPAWFSIVPGPRPMGTVAFTLQLTSKARALDPADPIYFRSWVDHAADGFVIERRELWTGSGELIAINPQTFVIIK